MYGLDTEAKFKIGDRVQVVKLGDGYRGSGHGAGIGDTGTVFEVDDDSIFCGDMKSGTWFFNPDEIELAGAAAAQVRRFNAGDRVRVTRHSGYFAAGDIGKVERQSDNAVFVKHGAYQRIGLPIDAESLELMEAAEAEAVDCAGRNGQSTSALASHVIKLDFDIAGLQEAIDTIRAASGPCIVARVVDGTPRPSNIPYVHHDVASATTEAERLARNNPGQEFAVYQRVAGRVAEVEYKMKEVA